MKFGRVEVFTSRQEVCGTAALRPEWIVVAPARHVSECFCGASVAGFQHFVPLDLVGNRIFQMTQRQAVEKNLQPLPLFPEFGVFIFSLSSNLPAP
jgi:hypothetical protein